MGPEWGIAVAFVLFFGLLMAGLAVPMAIAVPALFYLYLQGGLPAFNSLGFFTWGSMNSFTLTAVPLFIFMAEILSESGLSTRVYGGLAKVLARVPGGLLQTNIAGSAIFSAVSGSSVATAASIGRVALPQLLARGYSKPLSAGSLAAGGTLGILIPPSIAMIIYGAFTQTSVPQLFMAGLIPGLVLSGLFMVYIAFHAMLMPRIAPRGGDTVALAQILATVADIAPFFVLILGTLGGLYFGIVTTSEAAAIGCFLAIILGAVWGDLRLPGLVRALNSTILLVGNILFLILAAYIFSSAISFSGVGATLTSLVTGFELTRFEFFLVVFAVFTVLGCLIESLGMIVITLPLLFPLIAGYGIDPLLFGVVMVLFVELAQITPPMGINLFIIQGIWSGKLGEVIVGAIPFALIIFVTVFIVIVWPEVALWLPGQMSR